ncbi:MAG: AbrB/MazE/SpoVT family DNA-binding domain-containing protein, partial [Nanoarchaeota archaeon]
KGIMEPKRGKTPEGVSYAYFRCKKCSEEIVDMKQLHEVAERYRTMKKYRVKVNKWGLSFGIRIPKEVFKKYKFGEEVSLIPEKEGVKIVP